MKKGILEIFILLGGFNMEDFYYEETNSKYIFLKCLIYLFIIGVFVGIFLYLKRENTIKLKNISIEVGENLSNNIGDYLLSGKNNIDDYKLDISNVDIKTVGVYSYKVKYNKHTKTGTIKVKDTTKPVVELDSITIGVEEEFNTNLLLASCEDYSLPCVVEFKNENDSKLLKNAGVYNIDFIIKDSVGNKVEKETTITVSESETLSSRMSNDLEYYSNSEKDVELEHIFFKKLDKAIYEDTEEYEGMIHEISTIDFDSYVSGNIYSTKLITAYNKYGYVIGIQVEVTLDSGEKILLQDKVIDNEE